ncbi:MAG: hypothetical protein EZS28_034448 [Streblomastix strix]|uniref:Uncharacterized protein n=1 Tax=Streblomastix strix TaxID=222440 RepID=A0A5J4UGU9_9EUKA|nr:MAG: hypothetical protein EZS28_034448 [Streblomastix strix]
MQKSGSVIPPIYIAHPAQAFQQKQTLNRQVVQPITDTILRGRNMERLQTGQNTKQTDVCFVHSPPSQDFNTQFGEGQKGQFPCLVEGMSNELVQQHRETWNQEEYDLTEQKSRHSDSPPAGYIESNVQINPFIDALNRGNMFYILEFQAFWKEYCHKLLKRKPQQFEMRKDSPRSPGRRHENDRNDKNNRRDGKTSLAFKKQQFDKGLNPRRNFEHLDTCFDRQPANPDSRTQTQHVIVPEIARDKQIFLSNVLISEDITGEGASAQLSAEHRRNMRLNALNHGNWRQYCMIRANFGLDHGTGVHNDRILPDFQVQPQRYSFSYNSQTLSVQRNTENKQGLQGDTSDGTGRWNFRNITQRTSETFESNFQSIEIGWRKEKDSGCSTIEQQDHTFFILSERRSGYQNDNLTYVMDDQIRSKVSIPSSDRLRTTQTLSSIRSGGSVLQIQGNALWDPTLTNFFHRSNESNPSGGEKDMGSTNNQLIGLYSPITPGLIDLETTNNPFDGNIRTVWSINHAQEMRAGTETRDSLIGFDLKFCNNGIDQSKINEFEFAQETNKDHFEQQRDSGQLSGKDNWNFKFSQNTVLIGFLNIIYLYSTQSQAEMELG